MNKDIFNSVVKKKFLSTIFAGLTCCVLLTACGKGDVIYNTSGYHSMGSYRVKVYENGEVYDDIEIEDPEHVVKYKYVRTLNKEEIEELKSFTETESKALKIIYDGSIPWDRKPNWDCEPDSWSCL